jgi:predicted ATP-dependent protease
LILIVLNLQGDKVMSKKSKVSLDLLKEMVAELEKSLAFAEASKGDAAEPRKYIFEMLKAAGLATGISAEAGALVGDIHHAATSSAGVGKEDFLSSLLGAVKGGGLPGNN